MKKFVGKLVALAPLALVSASAFANEAAGGGEKSLGAAIAIGAAVIGGSLGQGKLAASALDGMARNPQAKLVGPMIIGLALVESLVIYALLVAFVKY